MTFTKKQASIGVGIASIVVGAAVAPLAGGIVAFFGFVLLTM